MARAASLALLLGMSALPGCQIVDLQAPAPSATTGALSVIITEADTFALQLGAWMNTGLYDFGRARELADPALLVNGQPLQPHRFVPPDDYYYQITLDSAAAAERVLVRLPVVAGYNAAPIDVGVPVLRRASPYRLQLSGGDLVLALAAGPVQAVPQSIRWNLDLAASCASSGLRFLQLNGSVLPGPVLTVGRSTFEQLGSAEFYACLHLQAFYTVRELPYQVGLQVNSTITWRVIR